MAKPIADDIPTTRAWQEGRRIYVRCGYKTQLNQALRSLGAHWDSDQRARWVGVTKKTRVVELVRAHEQRITALEEVKQAGRWISIPYEAGEVRTKIKTLGGVWDPQTKRWALPSEEAHAEAQALVAEWYEKRRAAREAEQAAAREAEKAAREAAATAEQIRKAEKAAAAAARAERIVAEAGRTPTGETTSYTVVSTRRMNRATALNQCTAVGTVIRLNDGRRAVVVRTGAEFISAEYASSVCWHNDPDYVHGDAHWHLWHEVAIVEATEEEIAADEQERAEHADEQALRTLLEDASRSGEPATEVTRTADEDILGIIRKTGGSLMPYNDGQVVLLRDGRALYQHPGYYDDYIPTEKRITTPALVQKARALIAKGPRTRGCYTVEIEKSMTQPKEMTCAELARRYGVHRATVARAIERGQRAAAVNPSVPAPPKPTNPGEPQLRYPVAEMDAWWPHRPDGRGRPRANTQERSGCPGEALKSTEKEGGLAQA